MTRYLLDTNILSDLIRNPQGKIASKISIIGEANVFTSIVVAAELRFGARKKGSKKLSDQVSAVLSAIVIEPLGPSADETYAEVRNQLESDGTPIGANDTLIAAHCMALETVVVTANESEFRRVKGLEVENWLA
ncbi:MAG: type II toxin-antitoxin system VapC family toxin [Pseudomonadota bacterium]